MEFPEVPRLHWAWVLVLSAATGGLFGDVWLIIQANWTRKVRGSNLAFVMAIVSTCLTSVSLCFDLALRWNMHMPEAVTTWLSGLLTAVYIATVYTLRYEWEREPINMSLSYWLPLFLGPVYLQYYLQDYVEGGVPVGRAGNTLGL